MKERFIQLWGEVKRDGVKEMLEWLETTDFYAAPCSTKYHLARESGLLEHSLNVYDCLATKDLDPESVTITALSHDFCKIGFYAIEMKWRKDANNQ
jgi:Predicted HD-superfamily hydrolase